MLVAGRERLQAALAACGAYLPAGTSFTRPQGGMNVWVELPEPLDAAELLPRAEREGVSYLPGRYFAVSRPQPNGLRLSFAGMTPEEIRLGAAVLGRIFQDELERARAHAPLGDSGRASLNERRTLCFWMKVSIEGRAGRDAEGRRHHGRHQRRAGRDCGEGRRLRGDGAGARALRYSQGRRRGAHGADLASSARSCSTVIDSGDGQGAHRPLHGSAHAGSAGRRLHRRKRSADAGR